MLFFDLFRRDRPPLIEQSLENMQVMLDTSLRMFQDATASLLENEVLVRDLSEQDKTVNQKESAIRRAVLEHVAIDPSREMIFSLILISIVQDAERIGDLAKSIGEVAQLADGRRHGEHVGVLQDLRDRLVQVFRLTRDSFADADDEQARLAMERSSQIKQELTEFLRRVSEDDSLSPNTAVVLAVGSRMFSRVSSHLSNIASSVAMPFDQIRRPPGWE